MECCLSGAAANLDAVKRKLAEAEALEVAAGGPLPHKLHPFSFVLMGLEIEDQQSVPQLTPEDTRSLAQFNPGNRSSSICNRIDSGQIRRRSRFSNEGMLSRGESRSGE